MRIPLTILALCTCLAATGCSLVASKAEITASANFDTSRPTGWTTPSGTPISFSVTTTLASVQSLQCRSALKSLLSSATYTDCTNGSFAPSETAGRTNAVKNDNGTYTLEVRGLSADGSVLSTTTSDFYVNHSLDSVPACSHTFTDAQYFAAAASYLSMTTPFGSQTNLSSPFHTIEFVRSTGHANDWNVKREVRKFATLRKKLVANGNNTLILLKQTRNRFNSNASPYTTGTASGSGKALYTAGECRLSVTLFAQAIGRQQLDRVSDGNGGYIVNETEFYTTFSTPYGRLNYTRGVFGQWTSATYYNLIGTKGHRVRAPHGTSHSSGSSLYAWQNYFTENAITSNLSDNTFQCEAVVFNALGKGICFRQATLAGPVPLRSVAPLMSNFNVTDPGDPTADPAMRRFRWSGSSSAMSNKKLVNDGSNTYWNAFAAANSSDAILFADTKLEVLNP